MHPKDGRLTTTWITLKVTINQKSGHVIIYVYYSYHYLLNISTGIHNWFDTDIHLYGSFPLSVPLPEGRQYWKHA